MFAKYRYLFASLLVTAIISSACVNDIEEIKKITLNKNDPDDKTSNLFLTYTDSGYAKVRLYAPLAETFTRPEKVVKFREGIKVEFYDEDGNLESILTALYGEINEKEGDMIVRDSVQLYNTVKKQRMETEVLYWKKKDSTIYTDKMVTVRTPKALFFGQGVKTKQDFSFYEILKPQGKIELEK